MPNITIPFYSGCVVVLSDLHLDKYLERGLDPFEMHRFAQLLSYIDALFLAGDLTDGPQQQWRQVSKYLSRYVPTDRIFVTPGNHDHFEGSLDDDVLLADETKKAGVHFAQKSVFHHGTTRILRCTLWSDFNPLGCQAQSMATAKLMMQDYARID